MPAPLENFPFDEAFVIAVRAAMGSVLLVEMLPDEGSREFLRTPDGSVLGFSVRTADPRGIMTRVREVCADLLSGTVYPDLNVPLAAARKMDVLARFGSDTGDLRWADPDAPAPWSVIRRAGTPLSFMTSSADLRAMRITATETAPGVLHAVNGDIAVLNDDGEWEGVSPDDSFSVADSLIPRLLSENPGASETTFPTLRLMMSAETARDAIEEFDLMNDSHEEDDDLNDGPEGAV